MLEDTTLTALAEVGIDPGTGLGQVHLGRGVPIFDGHTVAALRECGLEPRAFASHALLPPGVAAPDGFPLRLGEARGWTLVATGHPVRPPSWLHLSPVSLSGFWPSLARRLFEPQSGDPAWVVGWVGSARRGPARGPMAVDVQGVPLRTPLPSDCAGTARLDRGASASP